MTHLFLLNVLLILIGPFLVVGGQGIVALVSWPTRPIPRRPARPAYRPMRTAVAWC